MTPIKLLTSLLLSCAVIFSPLLLAQDNTELDTARDGYRLLDLDHMLQTFKPNKLGDVDITLFKKIQFKGELSQLPEPRLHGYMDKLLVKLGGPNPPKVTMGMVATSATGAQANLYIQDNLVPQANALLQVGDTVTFFTNHAYNSQHGPGLVVHAFERHPRPSLNVWQRLQQTWHQVSQRIRNTMNESEAPLAKT